MTTPLPDEPDDMGELLDELDTDTVPEPLPFGDATGEDGR